MTLADDRQVALVPSGNTPAQVIDALDLVFTRPYYLLVNGEPLSRRHWDSLALRESDVLHFVELPRGEGGNRSNPLQILSMIVLAAATWYIGGQGAWLGGAFGAKLAASAVAIGGSILINSFFSNSATANQNSIGSSDLVYSVNAQSNRLAIGSPFPESFGRMRIYPELAQIPYVAYYGAHNVFAAKVDQYLFFTGIIGVGSYDVEKVMIGDTDVDELEDAIYNVLPPATAPSIHDRYIWPNNTLCGQILNRPPPEGDREDWIAPDPLTTIITPPGCEITHIGWDMEFPAGCFYNTGGSSGYVPLLLQARCRRVDDYGEPLTDGTGEWIWLTARSRDIDPVGAELLYYFYYSALRASYYVATPYGRGRYEFWIGAIDTDTNTATVCNDCYLGQIRGYGDAVECIGDVTLIEMRVKATAQITGAIADKINVIATRKLYPVGAAGFGSTLAATRSPVDAAAYIVTCDNGGKQADSLLDWASLYALRTTLATMEYYFDYRFQARCSVMEACTLLALCARAVPYMPGGRFSLIQDAEQSTPSMKFTAQDYTNGSFEMTHNFRTADSPTCVEIHYVDGDHWSDAEVSCYDETGSEDNPALVELVGCTNRQQAYEIGMYKYLDDRNNRTAIGFVTGLKGHIPLPGAKVLVEVPSTDGIQRSGLIQKIDGSDIHLSEAVDFEGEAGAVIYISGNAGGLLGPYAVTPGSQGYIVVGSLPGGTPTVETAASAAARYLFALTANDFIEMRITKISPSGQNSVRIEGTVYGALPYADPGEAPSAGGALDLLDDILLGFNGVVSDEFSYRISWTGTAEKVRIELDEGGGYEIIEDEYIGSVKAFTTSSDSISVKVTPYDDDVLSPDDALVETHTPPGTPEDLALNADSFGAHASWTLNWTAVPGADYYYLAIIPDGETSHAALVQTATNSVTVTDDQMLSFGCPWASWIARVHAVADGERGLAAELEVTPPAPAAVTGLAVESYIASGAMIGWTASAEALAGYLVYVGTVPDFDPATQGTLAYSGTNHAHVTISGLNFYAHPTYYIRVAACSIYCREPADLNFSAGVTTSGGMFVYDSAGNQLIDSAGNFLIKK